MNLKPEKMSLETREDEFGNQRKAREDEFGTVENESEMKNQN